jgi:hypothetical protein
LLFEEIVIDDNRVVAVKPRPELAGFFLLDCQTRAAMYRTCGTDGIQSMPNIVGAHVPSYLLAA